MSVVANCQQMEGFKPMEVLPTNERITFHQLEGAEIFFTILIRIDTLNLVLDAHNYSAKVRNCFQLSVCRRTQIFEKQLYFHKICNQNKLIAGKNSNLHRIVMDMKRQYQGIKLCQNHQIKCRSFQLMEGNPSISFQYFHRLGAFHLLAFGYI